MVGVTGGIRMPRLLLLFVVIASLTSLAVAQKPTVKKVPAPYTSPASGPEMYANYCAACHGKEGKGNGPAAEALKVPPTDLTMLAKHNNGKFPYDHVAAVLNGKAMTPAHGSSEMPIWGKVFWSISEGHKGEVQQRVANLTKYIESMQVK
jgi:mono/diheme cytochrome c family protein